MNKEPYYSIGRFYREKFGQKIHKIPVAIADDCPNRRGLKGMQTCIFCDAWGSAAYPELQGRPLTAQITEKMTVLGERYSAKGFFVYFQAYTSTFLGVKTLRRYFDEALGIPAVKGIVIGTRPDCLSDAVFDLWDEYSRKTFLSVELGVQSFFDDQLAFLRRGHSGADSITAITKIKSRVNVDLGIHLIFGTPGESSDSIVETARVVSSLPVDSVKLHNLHVLKNTPLEQLYREGHFVPLTLEEYTERAALFLEHLAPHIAVHRLAALSSHWDELVAPEWTKHKLRTHQFILDYMKSKNMSQGRLAVGTS